MKHTNSFERPVPYLLGAIAILLLLLTVLLYKGVSDTAVVPVQSDGTSIPLANGSFNQAGDIQGGGAGLQNAASISKDQLDKLQIGR